MANVTCNTCHTQYTSIFEEITSNQGYECACEVYDDKIAGYYGTKEIDMEIWQFVKRPQHIQEGLICDECIRSLKKTNTIIYKRSSWV